MPGIVSDIVDVYVFRRLNARVQFLMLQRRHDVAMAMTWQGFHAQIEPGEATLDAARRAVREMVGLHVSAYYSADYVNQFYDDFRDVLVLAPVVAVQVSPQAPVRLGEDFRDCAWFERDDATVRLPFAGQRWAVRHIDEIMSIGERESELYRLLPPDQLPAPAPQAPSTPTATPAHAPYPESLPEETEGVALGETYEEVAKPSDPTSSDLPGVSLAELMEPDLQDLAADVLPDHDKAETSEADIQPFAPPAAATRKWQFRRRDRTGGDGVY
ncbi:MAG: NUDIX domain-containing protein [Thermomicrobiales bacterium]